MEYEKIKQLIEDVGNSKLSSIDITFPDGTKINMKKEDMPKFETNKQQINENVEPKIEPKNEGKIIKSPMVGTFYLRSSPDSAPYVEVGEYIKKGDIVCIIEAMKLMNEIEAEFEGQIKEVLVKDGEMVEYGKPLFRII